MPTKIRWGILGAGHIAHKLAHDIQLVEQAELYAIGSRSVENAESFARQYNMPKWYGTYEELASDPLVDVIYIATPHVFHFENTMMCLRKEKHVLCEKPFAINKAQVEEMIDEAKSRNLFLMEAMWTRFVPATEKVLELIGEDKIGKVNYVRADFGFKAKFTPEGRLFNKKLGGGALLDIGIYPIYLSLLLMGYPKRIKALAHMTDTGVDGFCGVLFDYENGSSISESTLLANTPIEAEIHGDKGSIKMHGSFHYCAKITLKTNDGKQEELDVPYVGIGYYHEVVEVCNCLFEEKTESTKMSHQMSINLISALDKVRDEIGLVYQDEK